MTFFSDYKISKFSKNINTLPNKKKQKLSANQRVFPAETRLTVYRRRNIPPPSVLAPESRNSKFMAKQFSNCNISAPRAYLEISLGPTGDIVSKNRSVPKMVQNDHFLINLPQRESLQKHVKNPKNVKNQ